MLLQKTLLSGALIATAVTSQAVLPDKTLDENEFDMLPACFAYNGEPSYYATVEEEENATSIKYKLYSRTFSEKGYVEFPYQTYTETRTYLYNPPILNYSFRCDNEHYFSLEDAEEYATYYGLTDKIAIAGGMYYFFLEGYLPEDRSDLTTDAKIQKYLLEHSWENVDVNGYTCYATYTPAEGEGGSSVYRTYSFDSYNVVGYSDEYEETTESWDYEYSIKRVHVRDAENDREFYDSLAITQCLFNDDEEYEALIPNYELYTTEEDVEVRCKIHLPGGSSYMDIPGKEIYTESVIRGMNLIKGNSGEVISTFEIPQEYNLSSVGAYLYIDGENKYLLLNCYGYGESFYLVYELPKSGVGGVQSPKLIETVKVRPTVVKQGEDISIEVGDDTEIEAITVTDMKGATRRVTPSADKSRTAINSGRLSRGMHIVGVKTGNGTQNSKVIVK